MSSDFTRPLVLFFFRGSAPVQEPLVPKIKELIQRPDSRETPKPPPLTALGDIMRELRIQLKPGNG